MPRQNTHGNKYLLDQLKIPLFQIITVVAKAFLGNSNYFIYVPVYIYELLKIVRK